VSFSRKARVMTGAVKFFSQPEISSSRLVITWADDFADLGERVATVLLERLGGQEYAALAPVGYFSLAGVSVESDLVRFPKTVFWYLPSAGLVLLRSDMPLYSWDRFVSSVLDIAQENCHVTELYSLGSIPSFFAHTGPREIIAVSGSPEERDLLTGEGINREMDFETVPGQKPSIKSFVLWSARRRGLRAYNLWLPSPFYLRRAGDPAAVRRTVDFLGRRLGVDIDLGPLDGEVAAQHKALARLRQDKLEVDKAIGVLETNLSLSQAEAEQLAGEVDSYFTGMAGGAS